MKTPDQQFIDWESDTFGFGYGTGEQYTLKALKQFMDSLEDNRSYNYEMLEKIFTPLSAWLLINIFGHADIIEYGTSPRFGWLTEKGELLRNYLADKSVNDLYELVMGVDQEYARCGSTYCNCDAPKNFERKCINNPLF